MIEYFRAVQEKKRARKRNDENSARSHLVFVSHSFLLTKLNFQIKRSPVLLIHCLFSGVVVGVAGTMAPKYG